jgi:capsular polysaccharide biosynthesis protein
VIGLRKALHAAGHRARYGTSRPVAMSSLSVRRGLSHLAQQQQWFRPNPCDNVAEWASRQAGYSVREIFPPRTLTRSPPHTIEPNIHPKYLERMVVHQRRKYIVPINGARIVGSSGLIRLPDKTYAVEAAYSRENLNREFRYHLDWRRRVEKKQGTYFSLIHLWSESQNYYHWIHESLEKLYGVLEDLPNDVKFIVPSDLLPLQREMLGLLGIDDTQLALFPQDEVWELETLIFATPTFNRGTHWRDADLWLRDKILAGYGAPSSATGRRLYISRRDVPRRNLLNEEEVEKYLHGLGFETFVLSELPLRDQVQLFTEASIVVSTMGASFVNILFSPPGTIVVDMIPPEQMSNCYVYWEMCEGLGHQYWYFATDSIARTGGRNDHYTVVPIEKLAATMHRLGVGLDLETSG